MKWLDGARKRKPLRHHLAAIEPLEQRALLSVAVSWALEASAFGSVSWSGIGNENTGNAPTTYGLDETNKPDATGTDFPAAENKRFAGFSSDGSVSYDG